MYTSFCCDMIAKKREVATESFSRFSVEQCQEDPYSGSNQPGDKSLYRAKCLPKSRNDVRRMF